MDDADGDDWRIGNGRNGSPLTARTVKNRTDGQHNIVRMAEAGYSFDYGWDGWGEPFDDASAIRAVGWVLGNRIGVR